VLFGRSAAPERTDGPPIRCSRARLYGEPTNIQSSSSIPSPRCYTSGDVRRLHRIVALRSLGISLEEIGTLLDGEPDPTGLLRRQLDVVEERIRKASGLRARLLDVLNNLSLNAEPSGEQLLLLIEETVAMNEPMTPEQFAELKEELQRQVRELVRRTSPHSARREKTRGTH
jgi:DNA-binding transcriptional MerR regulator